MIFFALLFKKSLMILVKHYEILKLNISFLDKYLLLNIKYLLNYFNFLIN